eukprot:CAMPEP_0202861440 /NCGR_PEP_ID=MMETSP1391-20130828/2839_1 /ASSEMBLY_ACC=CAM_ASM_000867 /TAXON_ID=1034604 /ORGANISM="Chlamydomonas leiostraca, Strain SAG 11-49" /LENGTH=337 /DNA_ID=CAMNT_0049540831 /DNA_START=162 /DNA_END=1175 /DNA_ORIENTATION=-
MSGASCSTSGRMATSRPMQPQAIQQPRLCRAHDYGSVRQHTPGSLGQDSTMPGMQRRMSRVTRHAAPQGSSGSLPDHQAPTATVVSELSSTSQPTRNAAPIPGDGDSELSTPPSASALQPALPAAEALQLAQRLLKLAEHKLGAAAVVSVSSQLAAMSPAQQGAVGRAAALVEARAGAIVAARVLARHAGLMADPRFGECWEFCAGIAGGDEGVAALLLGTAAGARAYAGLMAAGPFRSGATLLWLREELGQGMPEVLGRLLPCYPELLTLSVEQLDQAVSEIEALGLFADRQELRRLLAQCPAVLCPDVYPEQLAILKLIAKSRANKYTMTGSYHV